MTNLLIAIPLLAGMTIGMVGCACKQPQWHFVAAGEDCTATDIACTAGTAAPEPGLCSPGAKGKTAVCWDGVAYSNTGECFGATSWCTYKTTPAASCKDGGNKGIVYECK